MRPIPVLVVLLGLMSAFVLPAAQNEATQKADEGTPTFRVSAPLVVLDVTVVDEKQHGNDGRQHAITNGLERGDFRIWEHQKEQEITVFEEPRQHEGERLPSTLIVLDLMNTKFEDSASVREQTKKYLLAQPAKLGSPVELLVFKDKGLSAVQVFTTDRAALLDALAHVPAVVPQRLNGAFFGERFVLSIDALRQIASQTIGVAGRKNILWVGAGGPGIPTFGLDGRLLNLVSEWAHETTNMLVRARCSLFVLRPKVSDEEIQTGQEGLMLPGAAGFGDPFAGDIAFVNFGLQTGGALFEQNDVANEIQYAERFGSDYYTLGYRPSLQSTDGKFVPIRVQIDRKGLRAITKSGYYGPDTKNGDDESRQNVDLIAEAVKSTIPSNNIGVAVEKVEKQAGTENLRIAVAITPAGVKWHANGSGGNTLDLRIAAASLNHSRDIVASNVFTVRMKSPTSDAADLAKPARMTITLSYPQKAETARVVVQTVDNGSFGSADVNVPK